MNFGENGVRVVLDTNFWVSALVYSRESSALRQILERFLEGDFVLITSPALLDEFSELCERHNVAEAVIEKYVTLMQRTRTESPPYVHRVVPTDQIDVVSADPDDNRVLECAITGKADSIVSGDKHLRDLESYQGIPILSPRDFLTTLGRET